MLEGIKAYAWEYRWIIIVAICVIVYFIVDRQRAIGQLRNLMLQAERKAKQGILTSGQDQEDWVVTKAMCFLPKWWTVFVGKSGTRKIVKRLFQLGKDYFDDGVINNSTGDDTEPIADTIIDIIRDTPEPAQQVKEIEPLLGQYRPPEVQITPEVAPTPETITPIAQAIPEPIQQVTTPVSTLPPVSIPAAPEVEQPIQVQNPVADSSGANNEQPIV